MWEVLLPLVHSLDLDSASTEFNLDLITKRHWFQLGLDNKETLRFGNRKMKKLPEFKLVSTNTRLTDSKSNLTASVFWVGQNSDEKAVYVTKRDKNSKL
jgi:hypothetical protein